MISKPWKGLAADQAPVFLAFDQVDRMLSALLGPISAWRPEAIAAVARGGVIPAALLAGHLGLPVFTLGARRRHGRPRWIGPAPAGGRILVVDDSCSTGATLAAARALAERGAAAVATAAIVFDPDVARPPPDFGHPMRALFRLPWERGEATPQARAARLAGRIDAAAEAPFIGLDAALAGQVPWVDPARSVLIAGRAAMARPGSGQTVLCVPEGCGDDKAALAAFKATAAQGSGCTHYIDGSAEQAIRVASLLPHLVVSWWSIADRRQFVVGSAATPP